MGKCLSLETLYLQAYNLLTPPKSKSGQRLFLFEELGNVVVAGITSNLKMKGIPLTKSEGAIKDSVIKLNYIFTISNEMANKVLFQLSKEKKQLIFDALNKKL